MPEYFIGTDIVSVSRIENIIQQYSDRFKKHTFTDLHDFEFAMYPLSPHFFRHDFHKNVLQKIIKFQTKSNNHSIARQIETNS